MKHKMVDKMVLDNENSTPMDIILSVEDLYGEKVKPHALSKDLSENSFEKQFLRSVLKRKNSLISFKTKLYLKT